MDPSVDLENLKCVGEFEAVRQNYYIYEGEHHYILLSVSRAKGREAGNVNHIKKKAVEYVAETFAGEIGKTAGEVFAASNRPALLQDELETLNALYVLCALERAIRDKRWKGTPIHFNIRG